MTDVKKFLFDKNDFNNTVSAVDKPAYTEGQLLLAKERSFAEGKTAGLSESKQQQENLIAQLLQKTLQLTEGLIKNEDRREIEKAIGSVKLALQVVYKILPGFAGQYSEGEIESLITQSIETRRDEPHIAVTVPTVHLEFLKSRVDALAADKNYAGKIILLADDNLPKTDCRVEWANGGAERVYDNILAQIENEFNKAISGLEHKLSPTAETNPEK